MKVSGASLWFFRALLKHRLFFLELPKWLKDMYRMPATTCNLLRFDSSGYRAGEQLLYSVPHYKTGFLIFGHLVLVDYLQNACML